MVQLPAVVNIIEEGVPEFVWTGEHGKLGVALSIAYSQGHQSTKGC